MAVDSQKARRLAMLLDQKSPLPRDPRVLAVIGQNDNRAMEFIWENKGSLLVAATLTAFLNDPKPFIEGTRDLAKIGAENVAKPIAEAAGRAGEKALDETSASIARSTDWTVIVIAVISAAVVIVIIWLKPWKRTCSRLANRCKIAKFEHE